MVTCPECDAKIDIEEDELDEGDVIACEECGEQLRVVGLDPLELEPDDEDEDEGEEDSEDGDEDDEEEEEEDETWR